MLNTIEDRLRDCWTDKRLFERWAEYYAAIQIRKRNPKWEIAVALDRRDDIVCHIKNGQEREIRVEVKTGLLKTLNEHGSIDRSK